MIKIELSLRNLLVIAGVVLGIWLLGKIWGVVLLSAVGLLLAGALMPFVDWLQRKTGSRATAVLIVVLTVLLAVAAIFAIVLPPLFQQGQDLYDRAPQIQERAAEFADERGWVDLRDRIREFQFSDVLSGSTSLFVDTGRQVISVGFTVLTTFFLAAYFLLDARRLKEFMFFSTPRAWHVHIAALLPALQRVVGGYIRAQAITSGAIALFSFAMLTVLGVPNAIALAAIAAVADMIPFIGVYLVITPMAASALTVSPTTAIIVVGLSLAYQQFEDRVLNPRIYGATLRLPTIAVVLAILVGAELLGIVGALLGLPIAAAIRVIVEYFAGLRHGSVKDAASSASPDDDVYAPDAPTPNPVT